MIIHFVKDEKIIDQLIENFLKISRSHIFLVFTTNPFHNFKYIRYSDDSVIKVFNNEHDDINEVLKINGASAIVLHSLDFLFLKAIENIDFDIKIAWIEWGFELYMHPENRYTLYGKKTKKFLQKNRPFVLLKWQLKKINWLRFFLNEVLKVANSYVDLQKKSLRKIQFFGTYIYEDYVFFTKLFPEHNLKYLEVAFSTIDQYLANNKNIKTHQEAKNIFVGNSNSLESNYLDVINVLSDIKVVERCFFVLSYGNDDGHRNAVIKAGNAYLGGKFQPLLNFMDRTDYLNILKSCSVGVFYHFRQQAMGNIIAMLYMGARVYLSVKNPAYQFFLRKGVIINNFENEFMIFRNKSLEHHEQFVNKQILENLFCAEKVLGDLKALTKSLLE